MASLKHHCLAIFAYFTLSSCARWSAPTSTTPLRHCSTNDVQIHEQPILGRQPSPTTLCVFEYSQAPTTVICGGGFSCGTVNTATDLTQFCCKATGSLGAYTCAYYTSCADYAASVTDSPNILTCASQIPYCQSFTYPEVSVTNYRCDTTSDTAWQSAFLTSSSSALSNTTSSLGTSVIVTLSSSLAPSQTSTAVVTSSQTNSGQTITAAPSSGSVQDLTTSQKAGIGTGCGCAALLICWGIFLRTRRQNRKRNYLPPVVSYEKAPVDNVMTVQGQESAMEEISSH